jgi:hypothetical protein
MGACAFRLLKDRREPATAGLPLRPAERIFHCASGELSINEETIGSNEAHFSLGSRTAVRGRVSDCLQCGSKPTSP